MELSTEQKEKITHVFRGHGAVAGYLFGSYARKTAGSLSDLDTAVIFPVTMNIDVQDEKIEYMRSELEKIYGRDKVDIENISKIKNPLLRYMIILGEGVILFVDDLSLHNLYARKALRDFEDTQHLRNIQAEAVNHLFV